MVKAGLIGALAGFIYIMSLTLLSPFCTLCFTPLLGVGVGYLTGHFDKPPNIEGGLSRGSMAGLITGSGVIVGQMAAALVNGVLVTNLEDLPALLNDFGLSQFVITDTVQYWQTTLTLSAVCSIFNLMLLAGLGAAGGMIWFQRKRDTGVLK